MKTFSKLVWIFLAWLGVMSSVDAFSLRGPVAPWMEVRLGYFDRTGGPMNLNEEYRWNVPVVTYDFDESFLQAFGQAGVSAVTDAIQMLNDLPPSSELDIDQYPEDTGRNNLSAESSNLLDMGSASLTFLLNSMGLYTPEQSAFVLSYVTPGYTNNGPNEAVPDTNFVVIGRNFDPVSLLGSRSVNGAQYTYDQITYIPSLQSYIVDISPLDPFNASFTSVARGYLRPGFFYAGLTRDDVGGLRYLYSAGNRNLEPLLKDVSGVGPNSTNITQIAIRPGQEKIHFQRWDSNAITNFFTDCYLTGSEMECQNLQRVVERPDILFAAKDWGAQVVTNSDGTFSFGLRKILDWIDLTNWTNCSTLNGPTPADGPGLIIPGAVIVFQDLTPYVTASGNQTSLPNGSPLYQWASFDISTNTPVVLDGGRTNLDALSLSQTFSSTNGFEWFVLGNVGATYEVDTSSTLTDWTLFSTITNSSGVMRISDTNSSQRRFYRIRKQN